MLGCIAECFFRVLDYSLYVISTPLQSKSKSWALAWICHFDGFALEPSGIWACDKMFIALRNKQDTSKANP
jgi:hypothetical protein